MDNNFILLYVADPATCLDLASNSVQVTLFSSEISLFIHLWKRYLFIITSLVL